MLLCPAKRYECVKHTKADSISTGVSVNSSKTHSPSSGRNDYKEIEANEKPTSGRHC